MKAVNPEANAPTILTNETIAVISPDSAQSPSLYPNDHIHVANTNISQLIPFLSPSPTTQSRPDKFPRNVSNPAPLPTPQLIMTGIETSTLPAPLHTFNLNSKINNSKVASSTYTVRQDDNKTHENEGNSKLHNHAGIIINSKNSRGTEHSLSDRNTNVKFLTSFGSTHNGQVITNKTYSNSTFNSPFTTTVPPQIFAKSFYSPNLGKNTNGQKVANQTVSTRTFSTKLPSNFALSTTVAPIFPTNAYNSKVKNFNGQIIANETSIALPQTHLINSTSNPISFLGPTEIHIFPNIQLSTTKIPAIPTNSTLDSIAQPIVVLLEESNTMKSKKINRLKFKYFCLNLMFYNGVYFNIHS
jgi:hypothetical protein